jgi:hypothetical protein
MTQRTPCSNDAANLSDLATDRFTGSIDEAVVRQAVNESREAGRKAQEYLLSRVKPESNIRYR